MHLILNFHNNLIGCFVFLCLESLINIGLHLRDFLDKKQRIQCSFGYFLKTCCSEWLFYNVIFRCIFFFFYLMSTLSIFKTENGDVSEGSLYRFSGFYIRSQYDWSNDCLFIIHNKCDCISNLNAAPTCMILSNNCNNKSYIIYYYFMRSQEILNWKVNFILKILKLRLG